MEKLSKLLPETLGQSLKPSLQHTENELSLYRDDMATVEDVKKQCEKLLNVFPDIDNGYLIVLIDRIIANGFTKQRISDAINNIIDNCHYRKPMIAEIVSFDRKVKLFTYSEMCARCPPKTTDDFEMVKIACRNMWVEK